MLIDYPFNWAYVSEDYTTNLETLERHQRSNRAFLSSVHGYTAREIWQIGYYAYPFARIVTLPYAAAAIVANDHARAAQIDDDEIQCELGVNVTEPHAVREHVFLHPEQLVRVLSFLAMPRVLVSWQPTSIRAELHGLPGVHYCGDAQ